MTSFVVINFFIVDYSGLHLELYLPNMNFYGSLLGSRFWEHVKEILNPETSVGAEPWVYYTIYAFFVFVFNIFDIVSTPTPLYF